MTLEAYPRRIYAVNSGWMDAIVDISEDADLSLEVDLGRAYETLLLIVPVIDTSIVYIRVAEKSGGTFQQLNYMLDEIAAGGHGVYFVASSAGEVTVGIPLGGFQFIKIQTENVQTADRTFRVCGVGALL